MSIVYEERKRPTRERAWPESKKKLTNQKKTNQENVKGRRRGKLKKWDEKRRTNGLENIKSIPIYTSRRCRLDY